MAQNNTKTKLPGDEDSAPIQVLSPSTAAYISVNGASQRVALPTGAEIVMFGAVEAVWIAFGDSSVTAAASSSPAFLFPGGMMMLSVPRGATHVAAIQNSASTALSISKMV